MDDTEDDARFPPNPYPPKHRRRRPSFSRRNPLPSDPVDPPSDDDDDDVFPGESRANFSGRYPAVQGEHDDKEEEEEEDSEDGESRGKRRRVDRFALGFEFAPRGKPFAAAAVSASAAAASPPVAAEWSEESTLALLDAWGDRYVQNGRRSLRSDEWGGVAKHVSRASKAGRSEAQCRNRVDTLKKKYRKEKARLVDPHSTASSSQWLHFSKMDYLMSPPSQPAASQQRRQQPMSQLRCGVDAGEYVYLNRSNAQDGVADGLGDTGSEGDGEDDDFEEEEEDGEGMPQESNKGRLESGSSFRMLVNSIQKLGEVYERMGNSKRQQMAELEMMRKEFHKELEVQKRQILERAQAEIAKIRDEDDEHEEGGDKDDGEEEDEKLENSDGDDGMDASP